MGEQPERVRPALKTANSETRQRRANVRSASLGETNSPMTPRRPRGCFGTSPSTAAIPTPRF
jgi:hypothetical protein